MLAGVLLLAVAALGGIYVFGRNGSGGGATAAGTPPASQTAARTNAPASAPVTTSPPTDAPATADPAATSPAGQVRLAPPYQAGDITLPTADQVSKIALDTGEVAAVNGSDARLNGATQGYVVEIVFKQEAPEPFVRGMIQGIEETMKGLTPATVSGVQVKEGKLDSEYPAAVFRIGNRYYVVATLDQEDLRPIVESVIAANR